MSGDSYLREAVGRGMGAPRFDTERMERNSQSFDQGFTIAMAPTPITPTSAIDSMRPSRRAGRSQIQHATPARATSRSARIAVGTRSSPAAGGEILMCAATYETVAGAYPAAEPRSLSLKGKQSSVESFRIRID